jgi:PhoH-like ATPase
MVVTKIYEQRGEEIMCRNLILDTNVLIENPNCFFMFDICDNEELSIIINSIVIEELDNNKGGFSVKAVNSREASRNIKKIIDNNCYVSKNIKLIIVDNKFEVPDNAIMRNDKIIIETAKRYEKSELVTNDVNVQILGASYGVKVSYFKKGEADISSIYEEVKRINYDEEDADKIQILMEGKASPEDFNLTMILNEAVIFGEKDVFINKKGVLKRMKYPSGASGIKPRNIEQSIFAHYILDNDIKIVSSISKSGTGKSLIALAYALELVEKGVYDKVVVFKSITPLAGEDVGTLPGGINEKTDCYFENTFDALECIYNVNKEVFYKDGVKIKNDGFAVFEQLKSLGKLDIKPLTFMRGTSKNKTIFILEECQNYTHVAVKSLLTRLGEGSKAIICADISQIDSQFLNEKNNGASLVLDKLRNQELFANINLKKSERSKICEMITNLL